MLQTGSFQENKNVCSNFVGSITEDNSDKEDEMTIDIVNDSHTHGYQELVDFSYIIGTVIEEDNSDKEDEMEIAVSKL